jgi:hypothetical protein
MRTGIILIGIAAGLGACASDPIYAPPADQTVRDYVMAAQLEEIDEIRKGDRDTWQYVTDRYVIYRSRMDDYLLDCIVERIYEISDNQRAELRSLGYSPGQNN